MDALFFLGRKAVLDFAEFDRVVSVRHPDCSYAEVLPGVVLAKGLEAQDVAHLQDDLGGVVKVAQVLSRHTDKSLDLVTAITDAVIALTPLDKTIKFAVAEIGRDHKPKIEPHTIKNALEEHGRTSRFFEDTRAGLSASVLLHKDLREIIVVESPEEIILAHTIEIQNIDDWTHRDRQKPAADRRRGMLPPKLARIMVNLARPTPGGVILDPFCGTGTVLLEAMMMGHDALGSDIRQEAVDQAQANIEWFAREYPEVSQKARVFCQDATRLELSDVKSPVDAIVAEGYLGPQTPEADRLPDLFKGLEKLYMGSFKRWTQILRVGGTICLALPRVEAGGKTFSLSAFIDSLDQLGYNTVSGPYIYDRPETVVKRELFVLEYKGK